MTDHQSAKRFKTLMPWEWAPYDVGDKATICDGGTNILSWWGEGTNVVWHIVHPECTQLFSGEKFAIRHVVLFHQHLNEHRKRKRYDLLFLMGT